MKTLSPILRLLPLPVLTFCLVLTPPAPVTAQTFTTLHSFTATSGPVPYTTNGDGANPQGVLVLSGNTLFGTALNSGSSGFGTVFAVTTDGKGFRDLHTFTAPSPPYNGTNSDGATPYAGLILSSNSLYGTTQQGGTWGNGTVFAINTDGTGFTNLHAFTGGTDGANPDTGLILLGDTLYGTTVAGTTSGLGTVFAVNTDGTRFTNLHEFTAVSTNVLGIYTNNDGMAPIAGVILSGNTLFGTTQGGGSWGSGTVFAVNTDGTGFRTLHNFSVASSVPAGAYTLRTNSDGLSPIASLISSGANLYGAANEGGSSGYGTVFRVNTNGTGFTNLHTFTAGSGFFGSITNSDGAFLNGLILSGNTLYGAAGGGGSSGSGTVFALNTDGTGFTTIYTFTARSDLGYGTNRDGASPNGLTLSGATLYGVTDEGGSWGTGTLFSLTLPRPQLSITPFGVNLILTWPANYAGFDYTGYILQSTTNLGSPVWATNSSVPVVVNGQNTVTNPISGTQQLFRLSR